EALRLDPKSAKAYAYRALCYVLTRDIDRAAADTAVALRLDPKSPDALQAQGGVYLFRQEFAKAAAAFTRAHELSPNDATFFVDRAYARLGLGQCAEALA